MSPLLYKDLTLLWEMRRIALQIAIRIRQQDVLEDATHIESYTSDVYERLGELCSSFREAVSCLDGGVYNVNKVTER
jgi:hypothetical protein